MSSSDAHTHGHNVPLRALLIGAVGVVFGDIGTSPLYTLQECFGEHGVEASQGNVLGVVSLIVWSLTLVVTLKYLAFIMRADNKGEGGIFAMLAMVPDRIRATPKGRIGWVALLVLAGAGLLFGDGIITPAISVLSALEGMHLATSALDEFIVPATCVILAMLFVVQKRGTGSIGRFFGPVMVVWFTTIGILGLVQVIKGPTILQALLPHHGILFFVENKWRGFKLLGSVVLAVTGGEALYADMGHFGRRPIRLAWLGFVFPALVLCYLGQGSLMLRQPDTHTQPFFSLVPTGVPTYLLVALATPATVIASQALISGVFSLTHQAIRLGYFPRVQVKHTSGESEGQIYVPVINTMLAIACIMLVLVFQKSTALAAAFGLAVSGTMGITSIVYFVVARQTWGWTTAKAGAITALFLAFDIPFVVANGLKFFDGGYLPFVVGVVFFLVMVVWRQGRTLLGEHYAARSESVDEFLKRLPERVMARTPGVSVFMASASAGVPPVLLHLVRRTRALHERVVFLTLTTDPTPTVPDEKRIVTEELGNGLYRLIAHYGFMETPNAVAALRSAAAEGKIPLAINEVTFLLGRETFVATNAGRMGAWTEGFFSFLSRNATNATTYFHLPSEQVLEIGSRIDL